MRMGEENASVRQRRDHAPIHGAHHGSAQPLGTTPAKALLQIAAKHDMTTVSRKATLPIVCGVWIITLLVAGYTCAILPWFLDYYDFYQQSGGGGMQYPVAVTFFHRSYLLGLPVGLSIIGYGVHLLRPTERRVEH